jgi:hypothetical protein
MFGHLAIGRLINDRQKRCGLYLRDTKHGQAQILWLGKL